MERNGRSWYRREFLKSNFLGAISLGLLGSTALGEETSAAKAPPGPVIHRTLGRTGIKLPVVSMGVMNASGNAALVKAAFEKGIRHFDTAASYGRGRNEIMLGAVFKELQARDEVCIATKMPGIPRSVIAQMDVERVCDYCLDQIAGCLQRLQTDHVEMIYIHDVSDPAYLVDPGSRKALEIAKREKKARWVGFSTHSKMIDCLNAASRDGFFDVVLSSFNYSMSENTAYMKALETAAAKGIGLIAMKTQCKQPWYREPEYESGDQFYQGNIVHTALLKWVLRHEFITTAIPGFTTFQELDEDFSVAGNLEYTPNEERFLKDRNVRIAMKSVCQQCGQCVATCSGRADIPTLMRSHMYAACYSNFQQARATLDEIPAGRGLSSCSSCDTCTARCANRVDIARRLDELKVIFA
ncbi:MAG: aldo/keto reductase [Acidobacteriota bacterium]